MNEFFQTLKKDHKLVKDILTQLDETKNKSKREELFQKLTEALIPHMKSEETTFYPTLVAKKEAREVALEGVEEHHVAEMVFKELESLPKDQDQWAAKLSVFKELVEHHIQEEESMIFKAADEVLNESKFQTILKQFMEEKKKISMTLKQPSVMK